MRHTHTYARQTSFLFVDGMHVGWNAAPIRESAVWRVYEPTLFLSRPGTDPGTRSQLSIRDSMICMEYLQATPGLALAYRQQNRNRSIIHKEFLFDHRMAPLILVPKCPRR